MRLIPRILARHTPFFSLSDCRFRVTEDKASTARVTAWNDLKVVNSFTLETSFFGFTDPGDAAKVSGYLFKYYLLRYIYMHTIVKTVHHRRHRVYRGKSLPLVLGVLYNA